jgi:bidirectional [NiFe] hydrogenase diaphorase subunit
LKLPPGRVHGVAAFYHFFTLKPQKHTCVVRLGTACHVQGADKIRLLFDKHGVEQNEHNNYC